MVITYFEGQIDSDIDNVNQNVHQRDTPCPTIMIIINIYYKIVI